MVRNSNQRAKKVKKLLNWTCFLSLALAGISCRVQVTYPHDPGTLFIRQQICDLNDFKTGFFKRGNDLKGHGFLAYSFHRDPQDPKTYILSFKCQDLERAVEFIRSSNFYFSCVGAGLGQPLLWAGLDVVSLPYPKLTPLAGGIAVARYEIRDFEAWKRGWDAEYGGYSDRPKPEGGPQALSFHRLKGKPEAVIVVYEAPDIHKARAFLESGAERNAMETTGVTRRVLWFGTNLEEGIF